MPKAKRFILADGDQLSPADIFDAAANLLAEATRVQEEAAMRLNAWKAETADAEELHQKAVDQLEQLKALDPRVIAQMPKRETKAVFDLAEQLFEMTAADLAASLARKTEPLISLAIELETEAEARAAMEAEAKAAEKAAAKADFDKRLTDALKELQAHNAGINKGLSNEDWLREGRIAHQTSKDDSIKSGIKMSGPEIHENVKSILVGRMVNLGFRDSIQFEGETYYCPFFQKLIEKTAKAVDHPAKKSVVAVDTTKPAATGNQTPAVVPQQAETKEQALDRLYS